MTATTNSVTILVGILAPSIAILAGLLHVVFRLGRNEERLRTMEQSLTELRNQMQWIGRYLTGRTPRNRDRRDDDPDR